MHIDWDLHKRLQGGQHDFVFSCRWQGDCRRLAVTGASGVGKSLLLRLIAGLELADRGHLRCDDEVWVDRARALHLPVQRRRVGLLDQHAGLFPHLDVRQNMAFALYRGWRNPPRDLRDERVESWLQRLHLQAQADRYPAQLSGGQRQRVALARTLLAAPSLLLLDEPFAALDRALRQDLRAELDELLEQTQLPLIIVSHDHEDVECLAQEVLHLPQT